MYIEKNKENRFSQADELVKAFHDMNNHELKFMFFALSQREINQDEYRTNMAEILEKLRLKRGGNQLRTYKTVVHNIIKKSVLTVRTTAKRLYDNDRLKELNYEPDDIIAVSGALMSAELNEKTGDVLIKFDKQFFPLLDNLKYNHSWMYLEQASKLDGKYSVRFYDFCKMLLKDCEETTYIWYINGDSEKAPGLRNVLNIGYNKKTGEPKYKDWDNLKRRVIDPSVNEINEKCTDMYITYEILTNNFVYAIKLTLNSNNKNIVDITDYNVIADDYEQVFCGNEFSFIEQKSLEKEMNQEFSEDVKNYNWWETKTAKKESDDNEEVIEEIKEEADPAPSMTQEEDKQTNMQEKPVYSEEEFKQMLNEEFEGLGD